MKVKLESTYRAKLEMELTKSERKLKLATVALEWIAKEARNRLPNGPYLSIAEAALKEIKR